MDETKNNPAPAPAKTGRLTRFNEGLAYLLGNIFKFAFTIIKFVVKLSGLIFVTFPFVIFGMCLVAPDSAIKTLEAFAQLIQLIINIFKEVS